MSVIADSMEAMYHLDDSQVDHTVEILRQRAQDPKSRVFCIGNGGGYAHASHLASDLRKIAGIQALAFDNIGEMTARINDHSWQDAWVDWMRSHRFNHHDVLFMFSVGGGDFLTSSNLYQAIGYARGSWTETLDAAAILGIVGQRGGHLAKVGSPIIVPSTSTPVIEGCQSVIAHHIVNELAP